MKNLHAVEKKKSIVLLQCRDPRWIVCYAAEYTCPHKMCVMIKRLNSLWFQQDVCTSGAVKKITPPEELPAGYLSHHVTRRTSTRYGDSPENMYQMIMLKV